MLLSLSFSLHLFLWILHHFLTPELKLFNCEIFTEHPVIQLLKPAGIKHGGRKLFFTFRAARHRSVLRPQALGDAIGATNGWRRLLGDGVYLVMVFIWWWRLLDDSGNWWRCLFCAAEGGEEELLQTETLHPQRSCFHAVSLLFNASGASIILRQLAPDGLKQLVTGVKPTALPALAQVRKWDWKIQLFPGSLCWY